MYLVCLFVILFSSQALVNGSRERQWSWNPAHAIPDTQYTNQYQPPKASSYQMTYPKFAVPAEQPSPQFQHWPSFLNTAQPEFIPIESWSYGQTKNYKQPADTPKDIYYDMM